PKVQAGILPQIFCAMSVTREGASDSAQRGENRGALEHSVGGGGILVGHGIFCLERRFHRCSVRLLRVHLEQQTCFYFFVLSLMGIRGSLADSLLGELAFVAGFGGVVVVRAGEWLRCIPVGSLGVES